MVTIAPGSGPAFLCQVIVLNATVRSPNGTNVTDSVTINWTVSPVSATEQLAVAVNNDSVATFWAPFDGAFTIKAMAEGSAVGASNGEDTVTFTLPSFTKSSGAARSPALGFGPETVSLRLADSVPDPWTAVWEADDLNAVPVTLVSSPPREAEFTAPNVTSTTELTFRADLTGCEIFDSPETLTGTLVVPIQFASVTLDF